MALEIDLLSNNSPSEAVNSEPGLFPPSVCSLDQLHGNSDDVAEKSSSRRPHRLLSLPAASQKMNCHLKEAALL